MPTWPPSDKDALRYYRVAYQRLEDGHLVMEKLNRPNAAIYLTGYAVECILKALLIHSNAASSRDAIIGSFRGSAAHDLDFLRTRLIQTGVQIPGQVTQDLAYLSLWTTGLRYEPGQRDRQEALHFLHAAKRVVTWADGRM